MSESLKIGSLIETEQNRDAVHVAIAPVVAGELLRPGEHVGFTGSDGETVGESEKPIGVVDPFLPCGTKIRKGQRFWVLLYPGSITTLRHEWTHPAFLENKHPTSGHKAESQRRIDSIATHLSVSPTDLIAAATKYLKTGEYYYGDSDFDSPGRFSGGEELPDDFWQHYEIVTGTPVRADERENFFACSC